MSPRIFRSFAPTALALGLTLTGVAAPLLTTSTAHAMPIVREPRDPGVLQRPATQRVTAESAPALAPLHVGPQHDSVGPGFHMTSTLNLVRSGPYAGQIDVTTNTNTNSWGLGFTGGVYALFKDKDGAVVYVTQLHTFGVDAKSVFWGTSSRTVDWHEQMPAQLAGQVAQVQIIQQHTPKVRYAAILQQIEDDYKLAKSHCQSMFSAACPLP